MVIELFYGQIVLFYLLIAKSKLIFEYILILEEIMLLVNLYICLYLENCLNLYSVLLLVCMLHTRNYQIITFYNRKYYFQNLVF